MMLYRISAALISAPKLLLRQKLVPRALRSGFTRLKYTQYNGVKGIRSRKSFYDSYSSVKEDEEEKINTEILNLDDREYDEVANVAMNVFSNQSTSQIVLVIQPYVKWGVKKVTDITPEQQLTEAEALIHSLPNWKVGLSLKVPLESLGRKTLFGSGKLEELKALVKQNCQEKIPLTCLFINKGTVSFIQKRILEYEFGIPVMDRYSVVIQILRLHAKTAEARIQVAMAEIPYIWMQTKDANLSISRKQGYSLTDLQKEILRSREKKLKLELQRIRGQRELLRSQRRKANFPIVAVVGYTNAGKTSLIKALSKEVAMQPRDQLFATLDVTAHAGTLPCNLEVIYMDTVGFMSDLPTGLIECFVATLEDAMIADVIIHVQDLSHECFQSQTKHVEITLKNLVQNMKSSPTVILPPIINVGNKVDVISNKVADNTTQDLVLVSAKTGSGISTLLQELEQAILSATSRKKMLIRVRSGGTEMAWLHKNAAVTDMTPCSKSEEHMIMNVVISDRQMQQFKQHFCE